MPQRVQWKRLPLRSGPGWRPSEQRERGQKLSQGPRLSLRSRKRKIGQGQIQGPTERLRMRQRRVQGRGKRPRQRRKWIFLGLLPRLGIR